MNDATKPSTLAGLKSGTTLGKPAGATSATDTGLKGKDLAAATPLDTATELKTDTSTGIEGFKSGETVSGNETGTTAADAPKEGPLNPDLTTNFTGEGIQFDPNGVKDPITGAGTTEEALAGLRNQDTLGDNIVHQGEVDLPIPPVFTGPHTTDTIDAETMNKAVLTQTGTNSEVVEESDLPAGPTKIWTSHPIKNWAIGPFKFVDGQLALPSDNIDVDRDNQIADFERLLDKMPIGDRVKIKTLDLGLAEQIARESFPSATRGFDSGKTAEEDALLRRNPKVGTLDMGRKAEEGN